MSYPKPLHWWTDNVLPLVYDESLSYYEVMNKIVTYINGITQDTVELKNLVNELKELIENAGVDTIPQILERLDDLDDVIATLETDNTQNKEDIADLKTDNTQNKEDIADLKTDNTQNKEDISDLKSALESGQYGLSESVKQALLQIARKVAYIDDQGQTYYGDLYDALYQPKTITAVFEQGSTVIYNNTALNDLKQYLTVTAEYDDHTTVILEDNAYTLNGLLEVPTSTITVLYNGVSTTFSVAVTARPPLSSISAVYTQSGPVYTDDTLNSLTTDLVVTAHYNDSSTATVAADDYTLSGTLTTGITTITVSYGGKTTNFSVTVMVHDLREVVYEPGTWVVISYPGHYHDIYKNAVTARARSSTPIVNNNYTFTVTDSSKYNIAIYGVTSLATERLPDGAGGTQTCYPGVVNSSVSWSASASRTTPYIAIALKKMDGTEFTSEELANGAAAVFTYT